MSDLEQTVAKARLYDLGFSVRQQTERLRQAATEVRKTSDAWFEWRGDAFDVFNLDSGIPRLEAALTRAKTELAALKALAVDTNCNKEKL